MRQGSVLVAGLFLAGMFVGCGGDATRHGDDEADSRPRVAYVTNGVASFWVIAKKGAEDGGSEFDADVSVHMPANGLTDQKRIMEDLVTRGVDGIAVSPIDPANQTDFINRISGEVDLITHDSDAPGSDRICYIGMDNYDAGRMCGELVRDAMPDGGKLCIFVGRLEQDNARRRRQGLIDELLGRSHDPDRYDVPGEVIQGNGYVIIGTLTDQFDRAKAKANVEDVLSRHGDIGGMVGLFAYNPPLILEALSQAGRTGEVQVIAFDEDEQTLQGIIDGSVHGTIVQNPYMYGKKSIEILAALQRGDRSMVPEDGMIDIPARKITSGNVVEFRDDLRSKLQDSTG